MRWEKLGKVFQPSGVHPHLLTHAANPLPIHLENDTYRILFSGRDEHNRSSVGYFDLDVVQRKVIDEYKEPLFSYGVDGSFYSHGVSIGNAYIAQGKTYILFMGWQIAPGEHWRGDVGRLILDQKDWSLTLENEIPFMSTDSIDSVSLSYPYVLGDESTGYKMWYGSTITWDAGNGEMIHVLNYAESKDGHLWDKKGLSVPYEIGVAQAFSRPTVIYSNERKYEMWFSYRSGSGEKYRIGYAKSIDGASWTLNLAEAGIDVSVNGWDSEMICYPFVFEHNGEHYMLYNGNGHGLSGIGLAQMEK